MTGSSDASRRPVAARPAAVPSRPRRARSTAPVSLEQAREAALRLLECRARSARELRDRLRRRGAQAGVIDAVLAWLAAQGLVNDPVFARQWTESRLRTGHGRRRIALELRAKGIDGATIRSTLAETADPEQELAAALTLARRRAQSLRRLEPAAQRRRLHSLLLRRGYPHDVIERVLTRTVTDDGT